jgi:hypothetical protein
MREYQKARDKFIPCNNQQCQYWNKTFEGNCDGEIWGEPALTVCNKYVLEVSND